MQLGAEALADALLQLAAKNEAAENLVERMVATPEENIEQFKNKITGLRRLRRFIPWGESAELARKLTALLADLKAAVIEPRIGAKLVASFYETDQSTLGNCDDSSGHVGDVYRYDAKDLFVSFARHCADKDWLANLVSRLNREDDYGVRDALIHCASEYLPEPNIRAMITEFHKLAEKESEEFERRHWLHQVESLARQLKDAPLFEKTRIAAWGRTPTAACIDIGRVYLESGDANIALSWLDRIPEEETFQAHERDRLLVEIHGMLGNAKKQKEVAWRIFRRHRSAASLQELECFVDEDRDVLIRGEVAALAGETKLSLTDAAFLAEIGRWDELESYLLKRSDQIDGDFYHSVLPLAEALETAGKNLAASMAYRALLDSILRHARTKAYPHGIRYLMKLDHLAKSISDWREFEDHDSYLEYLKQKHGRKRSFWARYK